MTYLMPFTYGINPAAGTLVPLDDERLLLYARNYGTKAYMHLSTLTENGNFSTEAGTALLSDPDIWPTLADNILQTMYAKNYADWTSISSSSARKTPSATPNSSRICATTSPATASR